MSQELFNYKLEEVISMHEDYRIKSEKPYLILEGKTDLVVYSKILDEIDTDNSRFDIAISDGKSKIIELEKKSSDLIDYIAILDLDHSELDGTRIESDNFIYTHFYDMENYLTNLPVVYATYKDLKGFNTEDLKESELLNRMMMLIFPTMVAIEYKLEYLKKYPDSENIYSIDIIRVKDNRYKKDYTEESVNQNLQIIKTIITNECNKKNIIFDDILWNECKLSVKNKLNTNEYVSRDYYIQKIVKGRKVILAYSVIFDELFGPLLKNRGKDALNLDLRKNIMKSRESQLLVEEIDLKLKKIIF